MKKLLCILLSTLTLISFAFAFGCNDGDEKELSTGYVAVWQEPTILSSKASIVAQSNWTGEQKLFLQATEGYYLRCTAKDVDGEKWLYSNAKLSYDATSLSLVKNQSGDTYMLTPLKECVDTVIEWRSDDQGKVIATLTLSIVDGTPTYLSAYVFEKDAKINPDNILYSSQTALADLPTLDALKGYYVVKIQLVDYVSHAELDSSQVTLNYDLDKIYFFAHPQEQSTFCVEVVKTGEQIPLTITFSANDKTFTTTLYVKFA